MNCSMGLKGNKYKTVAQFGITVCIFLFWIYKIHLGIHNDEVMFVELGDMLLKGQILLKDLWTVFQFNAIFIAPWEYLFYAITGSLDGVIVFLRYVFVIIQMTIALWLYTSVKKIFS